MIHAGKLVTFFFSFWWAAHRHMKLLQANLESLKNDFQLQCLHAAGSGSEVKILRQVSGCNTQLLLCLFIFFPNLRIMFAWIQEKQINVLSNAHETWRQLSVLRLINAKAKRMIIQPEGKRSISSTSWQEHVRNEMKSPPKAVHHFQSFFFLLLIFQVPQMPFSDDGIN